MAGIEFDLRSDSRFLASLQGLSRVDARYVLVALRAIQHVNYSPTDFQKLFGWAQVPLQGSDTYPGGLELFRFVIHLPPGTQITVVCHEYSPTLLVGTIARY